MWGLLISIAVFATCVSLQRRFKILPRNGIDLDKFTEDPFKKGNDI